MTTGNGTLVVANAATGTAAVGGFFHAMGINENDLSMTISIVTLIVAVTFYWANYLQKQRQIDAEQRRHEAEKRPCPSCHKVQS